MEWFFVNHKLLPPHFFEVKNSKQLKLNTMAFRSKKQSEQLSIKQMYKVIDSKIKSELEGLHRWEQYTDKDYGKQARQSMTDWYSGRIKSLIELKLELEELLVNNKL